MAAYRQQCQQRKGGKRPLDGQQLRDLALSYVARYATSAGKLERYLKRKIAERGWAEGAPPADVAALVEDFRQAKYVDDETFARMRSGSLMRRGYGARRVNEALGEAGVDQSIRDEVTDNEGELRKAALVLARKRRFGPFGAEPPDRERREKQVAAMLRAGHSLDTAREMVDAASPEAAEQWAHELDEGQGPDGWQDH